MSTTAGRAKAGDRSFGEEGGRLTYGGYLRLPVSITMLSAISSNRSTTR